MQVLPGLMRVAIFSCTRILQKLLVQIPKWTGVNMVNESEHILSRAVSPQDFQVVLLSGTK